MTDYWISLQAALANGGEHSLEDQDIWAEPMREFGMGYRIKTPLRAQVQVLEQEEGLLIRGQLTGVVSAACDRCTAETDLEISHSFDSFESFPTEDGTSEDDVEADIFVLRYVPRKGVEVNLAALVWEEFMEALPEQALCMDSCKGLCTVCGTDLNKADCGCDSEKNDPRMSKLRGLKIVK